MDLLHRILWTRKIPLEVDAAAMTLSPTVLMKASSTPRACLDWVRFHYFRIPRTSLLGGVAEVSPDGRYSLIPGGQKQSYGAMLAVRAGLVMGASSSLGRVLTSESSVVHLCLDVFEIVCKIVAKHDFFDMVSEAILYILDGWEQYHP